MDKELNLFGKKVNIVNLIQFLAKIGVLFIIFVSIFLLSRSVLLSPDDYNYTFVQGSYSTKRVDSISNALETGKYFYTHWTGRVIPHVLIGVFRNMPHIVYEISNSIVFLVFLIIISKVLNKKSSYLSILSTFGYLAFSMMFGEKMGWISGSFNYLWPSTFMVIFIYYVYNYFIGEKELNLFGKIAGILFAFLVGFSHENIAFVGGAFLVCLYLFKIKELLKFEKNKKITLILIFVMFCLGAFATIFAPGNLKRLAVEPSAKNGFSWGFIQNYKDSKVITVIVSMILAFLAQNIGKDKKDFSLIKSELLYFILPALIATVPMAIISYFPPRAFLAYEVMFLIVLAKNVVVMVEKLESKPILVAIISVILGLVVFGRYSPSTLAQINYIIPYKDKVTKQYEEAVQKGEKDVLVSKFEYLQWIHREDYINIDNFFPEFNSVMPVNALISQYYGFDKVTAIGDNEYLIELYIDENEAKSYSLIEKETEKEIQPMEYIDLIRYCIPKEKLGSYVLDCRENNLKHILKDYEVRAIDGEIGKEQVNIDQLILTK